MESLFSRHFSTENVQNLDGATQAQHPRDESCPYLLRVQASFPHAQTQDLGVLTETAPPAPPYVTWFGADGKNTLVGNAACG